MSFVEERSERVSQFFSRKEEEGAVIATARRAAEVFGRNDATAIKASPRLSRPCLELDVAMVWQMKRIQSKKNDTISVCMEEGG